MSSNELQIFNNSDLGISNFVSVYLQGEQIFFCKEIGEALGYSNIGDFIRESNGFIEGIDYITLNGDNLRELKGLYDRTGNTRSVILNNTRSLTVVTESGLNALLFRSNKPDAVKIRIWVTSKVLPSIRKHGAYMTPATIEDMIANPANTIKLLEALQKEQENTKKEKEAKEEAIRTKALIGSKREATAMNTASQAIKKVKKLEKAIDVSREYASTKRVCILANYSDSNVFRPLVRYCKAHGIEPQKIEDQTFGKVNTYPAIAWKEVYAIDIQDFLNIDTLTEIKKQYVRECLVCIPKTKYQEHTYKDMENRGNMMMGNFLERLLEEDTRGRDINSKEGLVMITCKYLSETT